MTEASRSGPARPFGPGSISLGLHPATQLPASAQVQVLIEQARAAELAGFDGVTLSEHHAGFESYMPQPLLACAWLLAETRSIWVSPAPLLLGLRNPRLVAEELCWTAARHPGRISLAVAPGYAASDFEAVGVDVGGRHRTFRTDRVILVEVLAGRGPLIRDAAVERWVSSPEDILSAANGTAGVEAAALLRMGIIYPGSEDPGRLGRLTESFRAAGGSGPVVWIKNYWLGDSLPRTAAAERLAETYQRSAAAGMRQAQGFRSSTLSGSPVQLAENALAAMLDVGATSLNVRLQVAGTAPDIVLDQIGRFGAEVLPLIRSAWQ